MEVKSKDQIRVVIVPGNGCGNVRSCNWYAYAAEKLESTGLFKEVLLEDMPDPMLAREAIWLPFLINECGVGSNTIIIGHSSGAGTLNSHVNSSN